MRDRSTRTFLTVIALSILAETVQLRRHGLAAHVHDKPGGVVDLALPVKRLRFEPCENIGVDVERHGHALRRRRGPPLEFRC